MSLAEAKAAARKAAVEARATAHGGGRDVAARARLAELLQAYRNRPLAGYMAMRTEIDPAPIMAAHASAAEVGIPVIEAAGRPLSFALWTPDMALIVGPFGARIPQNRRAMTPEVLIVPLLAFDSAGTRLGYGGGFYDRTLAELRAARPTVAIGFAYAAQEVERLPREPTDQRVDAIVTEAGVRMFDTRQPPSD